jgi:cyclic pyranopterin phosphate synthase
MTGEDGLSHLEDGLSHLNERGEARMVDVTGKDVTARSATARCRVTISTEVADLLRNGGLPKGDALAVARIAAIQATKRTPDLIPLCHPIAVHGVDVDVVVDDGPSVVITATVRTADRTGVEMEALTAAAVGGLTVIDMVKGRDRSAAIAEVVLLEKLGGRSGHWVREP